MRNLLLFLIILIGIYYLRRMMAGDSDNARRDRNAAPAEPPQPAAAEQVLPCAHCGLLVPASEGVEAQGRFYCSPEHLRLGPGAS